MKTKKKNQNKKATVVDLKPVRDPKAGGKNKTKEPYLVVTMQEATVTNVQTSGK